MRNLDFLLMSQGGDYMPPKTFSYGNMFFAMGTRAAQIIDNKLYISNDGAKSYAYNMPLPTGIVRNDVRLVHVFSNLRVVLSTHTKMYHSTDLATWNLCTVLDSNGNTYVPELPLDNFTANNGTLNFNIDGKETMIFGNYNNNNNANSNPGIGNIYFSDDFGATLKIIFSLGKTVCANTGAVLNARHIHTVVQDKLETTRDVIYMDCGDEPTNVYSHMMQGIYNRSTKTWTFNDFGTGDFRKTVGIHFTPDYTYMVLDKANGGLLRVPRGQEHDYSKIEQVYFTRNECVGAIWGHSGQVCLMTETWSSPDVGYKLFYSRDKVNFTEITLQPEDMPAGWNRDTVIIHPSDTMDNGKAFAYLRINGKGSYVTFLFENSFWIDEALDKYGFPNAFK